MSSLSTPCCPLGGLRVCPDADFCHACETGTASLTEEILVVDDHDGFRAFARHLLEKGGFTVSEAACGAEAVEVARMVMPRLMLVDIQLPDFDGFEVARLLAGAEDAPVIVLTSTREASDYGGQVAASPAAGFLPKDELSDAALRSLPGAGPAVTHPVRALLVVAIVAASTFGVVTYYVNGWPGAPSEGGPPGSAVYVVVPTLVLLAYLVVGLVAWQRHPDDLIGPLFMIVGGALLVGSLTNLDYALPNTVGNALHDLYWACLEPTSYSPGPTDG